VDDPQERNQPTESNRVKRNGGINEYQIIRIKGAIGTNMRLGLVKSN